MEVDNPEYLIHEIFSSSFWKGHALGRPILGTKQTIRAFDRDKVEKYYKQFYGPSNILITAAGNLSHRKLVKLAEAEFRRSEAAQEPAPWKLPPQPHAPLVFRNKNSLEQVHLYLGVPSISMPHKSRFACYILNAILGGGMSSRLFQNIREKQGLAYTVYSELTMYRDAGCMLVYAGTSQKSAGKVIESVVHELGEIASHKVTPEELRRAKDHLKGSYVLGLESTSSRMGNLARQELYFKRFFSLDEMLELIESVTADQVLALAQQFFDPKHMADRHVGASRRLQSPPPGSHPLDMSSRVLWRAAACSVAFGGAASSLVTTSALRPRHHQAEAHRLCERFRPRHRPGQRPAPGSLLRNSGAIHRRADGHRHHRYARWR